MSSITRSLHAKCSIEWRPLSEACPDLKASVDGEQVDLNALVLTDPDGEQHVYCFTEDGRQALLAALTSGIVIPASIGMHA